MLYANTTTLNVNQIHESTINSENFIKTMGKYVEVENNKYVINPKIYLNKNISSYGISLLQNVLNKSNKYIKYNNITNLNIKNGNKIIISGNKLDSKFNSFSEISNGYNGANFYWWGVVIYLNSTYTQLFINDSTSLGGVLLSSAIGGAIGDVPGAIGGALVGSLISSSLQTLGDNTPEALYGSANQINYFPIPHVQATWAQ